MTSKPTRSESDVFAELGVLCREPGFVHAIAHICHRDNLISYKREMKPADLQKLFGHDRLIRTEVTTLLGLLAKGTINSFLPDKLTLNRYIERTDALMLQLHHAIETYMWHGLISTETGEYDEAAKSLGAMLREPIFYGGESAYSFQYRDFASEKYESDNAWLQERMGFTIQSATAVARAMCDVQNEKATLLLAEIRQTKAPAETWLDAFEQTPQEIALRTGISLGEVNSIFTAFTFIGDNPQFMSASEYNAVCATPLLRTNDGRLFLFQIYGIVEALYDSPYYWMVADTRYRPIAAKHRGEFTERIAAKCLVGVFGGASVFSNVNLMRKKGERAGEIDVLVIFGDRAIIVQAKSKKLTIESRKGNDGQLQEDFRKAIQESYDQAWLCAELIGDGECVAHDDKGTVISLPYLKEIFLFNVVSDHYPALAFQARQLLTYKTSPRIRAPFVMDLFLLDAMTEMLETPLRLLSYIRLRLDSIERLAISHELTALSYHLKRNLWLSEEFDLFMLDDDVAIDLDLAMMARREGVPAPRTPEGILTRLKGTLFDKLIQQIERDRSPQTIELGFTLLTMAEDSARRIADGLKAITTLGRRDGKPHDFTIAGAYGGITFHCNPSPNEIALNKLVNYCESRKYEQRASRWFGLSLGTDSQLQFGIAIEGDWEHSDEMDRRTAGMRQASPVESFADLLTPGPAAKIGRNDPCSSGSGAKFKKCCLNNPRPQ